MTAAAPKTPVREPGNARVTDEELFFDLVYAFAVTQLSHRLVGHLTPIGALQTLVLWFAVWLGWQYTSWATNWLDPRHPRIRVMLYGVMAVALVNATTIPRAFGDGGLLFAILFAGMQVGRALVVLSSLRRTSLVRNYQRILGWHLIAAAFWIAGGLSDGALRLGLWAIAVACEYVSPMFGFALPGLGRSRSTDWTIAGGHLAERNQLFVLIALGESIIATGGSFSEAHVDPSVLLAFVAAFVGSIAMWWVYFETGAPAGAHAIEHAKDPGRLGARFHYAHVVLIAGIIVTAVGDELAVHHPHETTDAAAAAVLALGPVIYLAGNTLFKFFIFGRLALSHLVGMAALLATFALAGRTDRVTFSLVTTAILVAVTIWSSASRLRPRRA